jgi:hypothetical protein
MNPSFSIHDKTHPQITQITQDENQKLETRNQRALSSELEAQFPPLGNPIRGIEQIPLFIAQFWCDFFVCSPHLATNPNAGTNIGR